MSSAAQKLMALRAKQAADRDAFEKKKKALENDMKKGRQNLKTIHDGLKNNEIKLSSDITSNPETFGRKVRQSSRNSALTVNAEEDEMDYLHIAFPVPMAPLVSDWCYKAPLWTEDLPPVVKTNDLYTKVKLLGRGAFGEVNLVRNENKDLFASKTIYCAKQEYLHESLYEVAFMRACRHPCVIDIHDVFITSQPRVLHMVLHYCESSSVSVLISGTKRKNSFIPETQIIKIIMQIALGVDFLHKKRILHRDLKADNIMLTEGGDMVKIVDFGLAVRLSNEKPRASSEAGTPYYMSPEIIKKLPYYFPADCWSLGVILHEMLCLKLPFDARDTKTFVNQLLHDDPPEIPSNYSDDIREIHRSLLIKDQESRMKADDIVRNRIMINKAIAFANGYRPKALEDKIRRAYVKILTKQLSHIQNITTSSDVDNEVNAPIKGTPLVSTKLPELSTDESTREDLQDCVKIPALDFNNMALTQEEKKTLIDQMSDRLLSDDEAPKSPRKFILPEIPSFQSLTPRSAKIINNEGLERDLFGGDEETEGIQQEGPNDSKNLNSLQLVSPENVDDLALPSPKEKSDANTAATSSTFSPKQPPTAHNNRMSPKKLQDTKGTSHSMHASPNQNSSSITETNTQSTTSSPKNILLSPQKSPPNRYVMTEEEEAALEAEEEGDDFV